MSPSKQERLFEPSYAFQLMKIAEGDLATAESLLVAYNYRIENGFFMAQQAIEKCLKAVLVHKKIPVPLVHDLGVLLATIPKDLEPPHGYELNELSQYAAIRRYQMGVYEMTPEELQIAIQKTVDMISWGKNILGI